MATERDEVCGGIASDESEDWWWCIVPMVIGSNIVISFSDESSLCLCCTGVFVVDVFVFTLTSPSPRRRYSPLSRCVLWLISCDNDLGYERIWPDSALKSNRQTNIQRQTDGTDDWVQTCKILVYFPGSDFDSAPFSCSKW